MVTCLKTELFMHHNEQDQSGSYVFIHTDVTIAESFMRTRTDVPAHAGAAASDYS